MHAQGRNVSPFFFFTEEVREPACHFTLSQQAAYDNLVWNECAPRYGDTKDPAGQAATGLLSYLDKNYNLLPRKYLPNGTALPSEGTKDK